MSDDITVVQNLRDTFARRLSRIVEDPDASAQELALVRAFLKDNNVTYDLIPEESATGQLVKEYPFEVPAYGGS